MRVMLRDYRPADDAAARAIYEESFPPSLRAPWTALVDHRLDERFVVLAEADGTPVGITLIRRLGDTDMAFVRYLAVDPARRDRGLGSQLVAHLRELLRDGGVGVLLLDVEKPVGAHADTHPRSTERRVRSCLCSSWARSSTEGRLSRAHAWARPCGRCYCIATACSPDACGQACLQTTPRARGASVTVTTQVASSPVRVSVTLGPLDATRVVTSAVAAN